MQVEQELKFGPYRMSGPRGPLLYRSQPVNLPPKALAVLWYLVTHAGQVVSKDKLLALAWSDTVVSEGVLTSCLRTLRQALRDEADRPRYIATVHRIGYRFIAPISTMPSPLGLEARDLRLVPTLPPNRQASSLKSLASPLVGRDAELAQLHSLFAKAGCGGRQLVFITGEAGIGKTALVETFLNSLASHGQRHDEAQHGARSKERRAKRGTSYPAPSSALSAPCVARGQCLEHYGTGEAYLPVLEALSRLCRQPEGESIFSVLRRVAPTWLMQLPALLDKADYADLQQRVAGATRERMLREIVEALEVVSAERSLVLVLEDVHWSDASTVDLLSMLVRRRETARILILATSRQAELVVSNHPLKMLKQELVTRGYATEMLLGGLQATDVQQYVRQRFAEHKTKAELAALVYRRTEGHPLFMVQLTDYLIQHAEQLAATPLALTTITQELPRGLRELIEVQVARLTPEERQVLEAGSVASAEFTIASVAAALGARADEVEALCEQLAQRGQFITEREVSRWPDGTVSERYGFRHALYQEVLYQRMSASRRRRLHQQIGEREEVGYGERASEIAAELAMHFERCHDAQRAVPYHTIAAQHAIRAHAHQEALSHIASGLALVPQTADPMMRIQRELVLQTLRGVSLVNTRGFAMPEVADAYERAHTLSLKVADLSALAPVLFGLWNFWLVRADLGRARELAQQLDLLAQRQEDAALQGKAHTTAGQTDTFLGNFTAAFAHFQQGLTLYDEEQHGLLVRQYGEDAGVSSHNVMGSVCWVLGYPDQARQHLLMGRQLAQRLAYPFLLVQNLWRSVVVLQCCGAIGEMLEHLPTLLREAEAMPFWRAGGLILQGWTLVHQGQEERGILLMQEGMQAWRSTGAEIARPYYLVLLADAYGLTGQIEAGLQSLDEAIQLVMSTDERWWEAEIYRLYGELSRRKGERAKGRKGEKEKTASSSTLPIAPSSSETCFLKAIDIARQQQAKSWELRAVMSLARLRRQQAGQDATRNTQHVSRARLAEAHNMLSEAYGWFTEGFDTKDLQEAKALLQDLGKKVHRGSGGIEEEKAR